MSLQKQNVNTVELGSTKDKVISVLPSYIKELQPHQRLVIGTNLKGVHGAGAAKQAYINKWIEWGNGTKLTNYIFPIPTKDMNIKTLPLEDINTYVKLLLLFAKTFPNLEFLVTNIGCGLAGYTPQDIAPMFKDHTDNVKLSQEFLDVLYNT